MPTDGRIINHVSIWHAMLMVTIAAFATQADLKPFGDPLNRETVHAGFVDLDAPGLATKVGYLNSSIGVRLIRGHWIETRMHCSCTRYLYM